MAIKKITGDEISELGISRLATRPNTRTRLGVSGMTPGQLRRAFDELSLAAIEKLNELIDAFNSLEISGGGEYVAHDHDDRYYLASAMDMILTSYQKKHPDGVTPLVTDGMKISPTYIPEMQASDICIANESLYYDGSTVEEALEEIGEMLHGLDAALSEI